VNQSSRNTNGGFQKPNKNITTNEDDVDNSVKYPDVEESEFQDLLTPVYYTSVSDSEFRNEVNKFVYYARQVQFQHPLQNESGNIRVYTVPSNGMFGAEKGQLQDIEYHPAVDLHVGNGESTVNLYAAHDGYITTMKEVDKYRQLISITKEIKDDAGRILGKIVTIYGHVDLDLDEASSLSLNGTYVQKGDLISMHLYEGTTGGPHLHFEVRYYRPDDSGIEEFYGGNNRPNGNPLLTEPSAGGWSYGYWNSDVGYGFANPKNQGLLLEELAKTV
jgi:murein DD-endopeptidase MepM/ murein hydrolase activator NlpD